MNKKVIIPAALASSLLVTVTAAAAFFALKRQEKKDAAEAHEAPAEEEIPAEEEEPVGETPVETEVSLDKQDLEAKSEIELDGIDAPDFTEQEETLESYIAEHPEEKASLDAVKDSFTADGVRTEISCTGDTMFFDFIMSDVEDEDTAAALKPDLEAFLEEQSGAYAEIVASIEEETQLEDIKMIVIFMDAYENEIVSGHYDKNGKEL